MKNMSIFVIVAVVFCAGCNKDPLAQYQKLEKKIFISPINFKITGTYEDFNDVEARNDDSESGACYRMWNDADKDNIFDADNPDEITYANACLAAHETKLQQMVELSKRKRVTIMVWKANSTFATIMENLGETENPEGASDEVNVWTGELKRVRFQSCDEDGCYGQPQIEDGPDEITIQPQYPEGISSPVQI